ncbi:MAG: nucleotidyltransferase family protein [Pseudohongiellaceae bacterium]
MNARVGALVLAAGFSNRFGSLKLAAHLNSGTTVFAQTLARLAAAVPEQIVVSRPELAEILAPETDTLYLFDQAERGMGATLAYGVSLIEDWDACLVCLADMPFITTATYRRIAAAADSDSIVLPTYEKKVGNPVAFGRRFFPELTALGGDTGGRPVLQRHPGAVRRLAVADAAILHDIDTPEDLARLQAQQS